MSTASDLKFLNRAIEKAGRNAPGLSSVVRDVQRATGQKNKMDEHPLVLMIHSQLQSNGEGAPAQMFKRLAEFAQTPHGKVMLAKSPLSPDNKDLVSALARPEQKQQTLATALGSAKYLGLVTKVMRGAPAAAPEDDRMNVARLLTSPDFKQMTDVLKSPHVPSAAVSLSALKSVVGSG